MLRNIFLFLLVFTSAINSQYDFSAVDKLLKDSVSVIGGTGGGCALIITKDGKTIYSNSFSMPLRIYSVDKVVPIASASKWLSAGVIMSLVDEKKISLDDSVGKYLNYFAPPNSGITIRQLFSHTSGYGGDTVGDTILTLKEISLDSCARLIAEVPLYFQPGTAFYYGGYGMQVAGRIAETASQMPYKSGAIWDSLFSIKLARPLGLIYSDYEGFGPTTNPRVAGGVQSSASEYIKYVQMLLDNGVYNGRQVLSSQAVDEMLKNQSGSVPVIYSPYQKYDYLGVNPLTTYGIGNWNEIKEETGEITGSGSQGAFGFSPWIDKKRNVAGVLSVFNSLEKVMPTYVKLRKIVGNILDNVTGVASENQPPDNFTLLRNYPNPFNPETTIEYALTGNSFVKLRVFDALGREVKTLFEGTQPAGVYHSVFDGKGLSSGIYYCRLESGAKTRIIKMALTK
jgi:CubicO group peptidase (beta-lactamase class C family)